MVCHLKDYKKKYVHYLLSIDSLQINQNWGWKGGGGSGCETTKRVATGCGIYSLLHVW